MSATLSMLRAALLDPPSNADLQAPVRTPTRAWPWLCDSLGHVNNVRYLDVAQDGRIWWLARMGLLRGVLRGRLSFLVAGMSGLYRRAIPRMEPFTVETRLVAFDQRFVCYLQTFTLSHAPQGQVAARFLCRGQLRDAQGALEPAACMRRFGLELPALPEPPPDVTAWLAAQDAALDEVRAQDRQRG
ncbi:MAG: acyl-CoA thioesterase [Myxococcales bacterium]